MVSMAREWADGTMPPVTAGDRDAAAAQWDRWHEVALELPEGSPDRVFAETVLGNDPAGPLLTHIFANSPYLARCLIGDLPFARELLEAGPDAAFAHALDDTTADDAGEPERSLMMRLRVAKRRVALTAGMADIVSVWPLERVTGALSEFAEAALRAAGRRLLRDLHEMRELALPDPDNPENGSGLIVLGMGKLGAGELNYSSDIDLIVLYDEAVAPYVGRRGIQRAFTRLAQGMVRIIGSQTAQGYVFRTDLRLRPDPGSTPPAISVRSADVYYRSAGRNWERAAMIKARPVAGDTPTGEAFLAGPPPVHLAPPPGFQGHTGYPGDQAPDRRLARFGPDRARGAQRETRLRRHPRDRIPGAGPAAGLGRPESGPAPPGDARGARTARRCGPRHAADGGGTG